MPIEIERKFLLRSAAWRQSVVRTEMLHDGLLARFAGGKVRVRHAGDRAWITVKGLRQGLSRAEYEYEITLDEAEEMLRLCEGVVMEKHRHMVPHDGVTWMVDVRMGVLAGIEFAEVELDDPDQPLSLPCWIGEEITGDPRYQKRNLLLLRHGPLDQLAARGGDLSQGLPGQANTCRKIT